MSAVNGLESTKPKRWDDSLDYWEYRLDGNALFIPTATKVDEIQFIAEWLEICLRGIRRLAESRNGAISPTADGRDMLGVAGKTETESDFS